MGRFGGAWRHLRASGGASWGRSESFLGRLVSVLEASWSVLAANFSHAILDAIFERNFVHSCLRKANSELRNIQKYNGKTIFFASRLFQHKIASACDFYTNLVLFWLQKITQIVSWRRLGPSWRPLRASWARLDVLTRLGLILERLGVVLERLGRVLNSICVSREGPRER